MQSRYRFEQCGKKLRLNLKKYKSLLNFDDSNYLLSCKIHNLPLKKDNYAKFFCQEVSCKQAFPTLELIRDILSQPKPVSFFIEKGKICISSD